jgi:hypothetical protein
MICSGVTGWTIEGSEFESLWRQELSLLHIQTGCRIHPVSYPMSTEALSPGVKRPGRAADHSPPTSAEVKKMWINTSTPTYTFMA